MPDRLTQVEPWVTEASTALRHALDTPGVAVEFRPAEHPHPPSWVLHTGAPEAPATTEPAGLADAQQPDTAVIVRTSGSTGTPKQTLLSSSALQASVSASAEALGGHGQWLLTLQPSYVAGLAVLARSLAAGTTPVPLLERTSDPQAFTRAAEQLTARRRHVSLVPTQLQRLLEHVPADPRLGRALARFDAILLGGGPSTDLMLEKARDHGLTVVRTYGMSETCGGCVYDGRPLPGVTLSTDESSRISISGPMVATGYLGDARRSAAHFSRDPDTGARRYRTDDLGEIHVDQDGPVLSISGRADDVVNTGGVKVSAEQVRLALLTHPRVAHAFVGPVPDAHWGQMVTAAVVLTDHEPATRDPAADAETETADLQEQLQQAVRTAAGPAAVPKHVLRLDALPLLSSGKPDRQTLLELLERSARKPRREDPPWQQ